MNKPTTCGFCSVVAGTYPARVIAEWPDAIALFPRVNAAGKRGCTDGHMLVIPRAHVADFAENPAVTAAAMARAAELAARTGGAFNLITSKGEEASQTAFHLHIHLVPRTSGDGLPLPWSA